MSSSDATSTKAKAPTKSVSRSAKAGLQFPVGRVARYLKKGKYAERIGSGAPVFLSAVLEYLAAEVLELAGEEAKLLQKNRITPTHIQLGVRKDAELDQLWGNAIIPNAGACPHIEKNPTPKTTSEREKASSSDLQ